MMIRAVNSPDESTEGTFEVVPTADVCVIVFEVDEHLHTERHPTQRRAFQRSMYAAMYDGMIRYIPIERVGIESAAARGVVELRILLKYD